MNSPLRKICSYGGNTTPYNFLKLLLVTVFSSGVKVSNYQLYLFLPILYPKESVQSAIVMSTVKLWILSALHQYLPLLINYSIYSTYTAKWVSVILVMFLLSYSHLGLYGHHLGLYGIHHGLYGFHLGLYRNPCIWLVRSLVSSVTWERSLCEFINGGPIFDFGKKCRNRNTTTTTPTFLSWGHFDLGTFRLYAQ